MNVNELINKVTEDLEILRIPIDEVDFEIRPYSTTYYGRYFPSTNEDKVKPRLFLYPFKNTEGDFYDYDVLLDTVIHEMVHHIQYSSPAFVRLRGVMHDPNFWKLYNRYIDRAKASNMIGGDYIGCKEECVL